MASLKAKTFRLRGIPAGYCKEDVKSLVRNTLNCNDTDILIRSLASDPGSLEDAVATVELSPVPVAFQSTIKGDEWCFDTFYNDENHSLLFDTNFLGPTPLHTPSDEQWSLDLVAVSGLGGHAFGSFKARGGSFMWLRDALPKDLPGARIIVYGTDTALQESSSFQNLRHLGHGLRSTLNEIRAQVAHKPLILIGHSLGGVIIKETVIQMLQGDDIDRKNRLSIYGILLFGVPNRGMSMESLIPMVGDQPNRFLLETLRAESEVLQEQTSSFLEAFPFPDSEIFCCYETMRSPTAQQNNQGVWRMEGPATVFVGKDSAMCLRAWETETRNTLAMNQTHSEMVKFPNKYDRGYTLIRHRLKDFALRAREVISKRHTTGEIQRIVKFSEHSKAAVSNTRHIVGTAVQPGVSLDSLTPERHEELQKQCLQSLAFPEQDSRAHALQPVEGTCDWIFENDDFCSWLRSSLGLFWIGGKPGSGKSMLMKRVVQRLTKENTETHVVASFFIYGQGVSLQKSRMGLYSALIHQLYQPLSSAFQDLIGEFQKRTDTRGKYGEKWKWTLEDIRSHLLEALRVGSEKRSIMVFVDALDEAGEEEAQKIIRDFDGLIDRLSGSDSKMKICFSCRHYPDLRLGHPVPVSVEEHNRQDIQMVIDSHLKKLAPKEQAMFQTKIVKNSRGIFSWATLVVDQAVRQRKKGKPFRNVFSTFQEGQADLYQLYEALLSEIGKDDRVQAIRLFQWMLFAKRPLRVHELQHTMALSHDMSERSISDYSIGKYFTDTDDLKARIMDLSKGLVEIRDPVIGPEFFIHPKPASVHFIHQSVVDYLLDSGLQTLETIQGTTIYSNINVRAHFQLSRSCLRLLFMSELEGIDRVLSGERDDTLITLLDEFKLDWKSRHFHLQGDDPYMPEISWRRWRQFWGHWPDDIGLLNYCWDHWVDHILQIQQERYSLPTCYRDYQGIIHRNETEWRNTPDQYEQCDLLDCFSWTDSDKFLQMCTRFHNGLGVSRSLIELQITFLKIWNVKNIVHNQLAMNIWSFALCGSRLIHFLALSGLKEPLQRMIDSPRTSLEVWDREGRTPLMYAILGCAVEIAVDLIHAKVDVDAQDIYGNTALHFASFCGEERVVEALLKAGANVNLQRMGGATPLHLATIAQHSFIIAKLLNANASSEKMLLVKRPEWDGNGVLMGTLAYASLEGHHAVVEKLLSHGVQPGEVDEFGTSPLHYSASLGFAEVIRALIEAGAPVNAQDSSGRTPLSKAIESNHQDAAEILICSGADTTLPHHDGRTPLDIAASNGHVDLAKLLIDNGVSLGKSLFHAALDGRADMVDFLIGSGAKVEDQDRFGRTPLFLAVAKGHKEVVVRLIDAKTPLNHADSDGKTALFYAVASGRSTTMIRSLLDAGADPNWHDSMGLSPMVYAACDLDLDILKLLREFGAVPPKLSETLNPLDIG